MINRRAMLCQCGFAALTMNRDVNAQCADATGKPKVSLNVIPPMAPTGPKISSGGARLTEVIPGPDIPLDKTATHFLVCGLSLIEHSIGQGLYDQAVSIFESNPPTKDYPYTKDDLKKYLLNGEFKCRRSAGAFLPLNAIAISYTTSNENFVMRVPGRSNKILVNTIWVEKGTNGFGTSLTTPDKTMQESVVTTKVGSILLYELLHHEGFFHAKIKPDYSNLSEMKRSLPFAAERALALLRKQTLGLTPPAPGPWQCGTG